MMDPPGLPGLPELPRRPGKEAERDRETEAPKRPEKPEPAFRPLGLLRTGQWSAGPSGPRAELAFGALRRIANLKVEGARHLSGVPGPKVLVANHTSFFDGPLVLAALPRSVRSRTLVAVDAKYTFKVRGNSKRIVRVIEEFPFTIYDGSPAAGERCLNALSRGWHLLMFPEGTRSTTAHLASFRRGPARLCLTGNVPGVPVRIAGTQEAWGSGGGLTRPAVSVRFGSPLHPLAGEDPDSLTARLHRAVGALGADPSR